MNNNKFQIRAIMILLLGFEFVQASSQSEPPVDLNTLTSVLSVIISPIVMRSEENTLSIDRFNGNVIDRFNGNVIDRFNGNVIDRFNGNVIDRFNGNEIHRSVYNDINRFAPQTERQVVLQSVTTQHNQTSDKEYIQKIKDLKDKQPKEFVDKKLAKKHLDANDALAAKLKKDIISLDAKLQATSKSRYEIDYLNYQEGTNHEESEKLFELVKKSFPQYIEGFKLLGKNENALYNFIQQQIVIENEKNQDEDLVLAHEGEVLQAIENEIAKGMQPIFIAKLKKKNPNIIDKLNVKDIKTMADLSLPLVFMNPYDPDPITKYIRDNKDGFMKPIINEFLRAWIVNASSPKGNTLLHKAASEGNSELVDLLIKEKANINAEDYYKRTPLIMAIRSSGDEKSIVKIVKMLIAGTNNFDDKNFFQGQTALYYAVSCNKLAIVQALLEVGANKNIENYEHKTPLMIAQENNNAEMIALLAQYPDAA